MEKSAVFTNWQNQTVPQRVVEKYEYAFRYWVLGFSLRRLNPVTGLGLHYSSYAFNFKSICPSYATLTKNVFYSTYNAVKKRERERKAFLDWYLNIPLVQLIKYLREDDMRYNTTKNYILGTKHDYRDNIH